MREGSQQREADQFLCDATSARKVRNASQRWIGFACDLCLVLRKQRTNKPEQSVTRRRDCGLCGLCRVRLSHGQATQVNTWLCSLLKRVIAARINPGSKEGDPLWTGRLALLSGLLGRVHGANRRFGTEAGKIGFLHGRKRN